MAIVEDPDLSRQRARAVYALLREANPWLPEETHVCADTSLTMTLLPGATAAIPVRLDISLWVDLPETFFDDVDNLRSQQ